MAVEAVSKCRVRLHHEAGRIRASLKTPGKCPALTVLRKTRQCQCNNNQKDTKHAHALPPQRDSNVWYSRNRLLLNHRDKTAPSLVFGWLNAISGSNSGNFA